MKEKLIKIVTKMTENGYNIETVAEDGARLVNLMNRQSLLSANNPPASSAQDLQLPQLVLF